MIRDFNVSIPYDVRRSIWEVLDINSLKAVSSTCKLLREDCVEFLFYALRINYITGQRIERHLRKFFELLKSRKVTHVHHLSASFTITSDETWEVPEAIFELFKLAVNVRSFRLGVSPPSMSAQAAVVESLYDSGIPSRLHSFTMTTPCMPCSRDKDDPFWAICRKVTTLVVQVGAQYRPLEPPLEPLSRLQTVTLGDVACSGVIQGSSVSRVSCVIDTPLYAPLLMYLTSTRAPLLYLHVKITAEDVKAHDLLSSISENHTSLRELHLQWSHHTSYFSVKTHGILQMLSGLTDLEIFEWDGYKESVNWNTWVIWTDSCWKQAGSAIRRLSFSNACDEQARIYIRDSGDMWSIVDRGSFPMHALSIPRESK